MGMLFVGVLVCFYLLSNASYIAGGRKACENTDEQLLVEGFKCEPATKQREIYDMTEPIQINFSGVK